MVLIAAMLHKAPGIASAMILFRCMHPLTVLCLFVTMFGNAKWTKKCIADADQWHDLINYDFAEANIPVVGMIMILSLCDVTMVQMLPWKNVEFYK